MIRYAIVRNARSRSEAEAYLPDNYEVAAEIETNVCSRCRLHTTASDHPFTPRLEFVIEGEDAMGWTLDGYVIPRYASGLIGCDEIDLSHPAMKHLDAGAPNASVVPAVELVPDEPSLIREAGFMVPVLLAVVVAEIVRPNESEAGQGQDVKGRMWDLLNMARHYRPRPIPAAGGSWPFPCIFWLIERDPPLARSKRAVQRTLTMKATLGPDESGEPRVLIDLNKEELQWK